MRIRETVSIGLSTFDPFLFDLDGVITRTAELHEPASKNLFEIGRATVLAFARQGAQVVVGDVSDEGAATVELITRERDEAVFVLCNVADAAEVEGPVQQTVRTYGAFTARSTMRVFSSPGCRSRSRRRRPSTERADVHRRRRADRVLKGREAGAENVPQLRRSRPRGPSARVAPPRNPGTRKHQNPELGRRD